MVLWAHRPGEGCFGRAPELVEQLAEVLARAHSADLALLADESGTWAVQVGEVQADDLYRPEAGDPKTEEDLVPQTDSSPVPTGREEPLGLLGSEESRWVLGLNLAIEAGDLAERGVAAGEASYW